ncbi:hypothetical protein NDA11_006196 [Ustilago hordei]|uniref:Uncharacterized protein n=1 Tax=Ustilago hordei TaxID=120017 RepID=I2G6M2_USTHO|nr:uncharacterized protein UHO2_02076 [Ustilago hordei]KAJ1039020.1 hypothetical protein NDA10_003087 [Ustilago hordei]KAJ1585630.1 hypothetical protein NDA12_000235 [Ustilago hordei]KAJ1589571.1 hypothetical protein NDA15_006635 [Ustilago hordei]KAJ1591104.1 hypothetical protein NDA11_006196 [Ustilago hordei]KAJ1600788.1 hypothetical protein NDA14_003727 [Ustilago hordei]
MNTFFVRRAFSSRSAIRAPPSPSSSTLPLVSAASAASTFSATRPGRVAMLPKSSESTSVQSTGSANVSTAATSNADIFPEVGSISVPGEQPNVLRLGESQ